VAAGLGVTGIEFRPFGTDVDFLPVVLGNGRIHLEVAPRISALDQAAGTTINGGFVAGRIDQRISTTVELETGQTFVIGGLIQRTQQATANKVPVLGQIPFLGALFSEKISQEVETELVVMVTAHLVDAQSACQVAKVLPGQETRTPDDFELVLEGILEAPRGPRQVFQGNRYVPSHLVGPSADLFPCAGREDGLQQEHGHPHGKCAPAGGCPTGNCGGTPGVVSHTAAAAPAPAELPAPPMANATAPPAAEQPVVPTGAPATVTPEGAKAEPVGPPAPPVTGGDPPTPAAPGQGQP
jgi:pilus assembly protein CpaC